MTAIMRPFLSSGGRHCMKTCSGTANKPVNAPRASSIGQAAVVAQPLRRFADAGQVSELSVGTVQRGDVAAGRHGEQRQTDEHADAADADQSEINLPPETRPPIAQPTAMPTPMAPVSTLVQSVAELEVDFAERVDGRRHHAGEQPEDARNDQAPPTAADRRGAAAACRAGR